jgi:ribosome-associated protein
VKAISEAIDGEISKRFSSNPMIEGEAGGTWILLDYGDIVVHIFKEDIRAYYGIENMWRDAEQVELPDSPSVSPLGENTLPTHPMKVVHH